MLSHPDRSQLWFQLGEVFAERTYLRHGVRLEGGETVLDVGANVGVAAAFFASSCGAATVHCFEPVPAVFEVLSANLRRYPACRAHPHGLSSKVGRAQIRYYPGAMAMSGLYADPERDRDLVRTCLGNRGLAAEQVEPELSGLGESVLLECSLRTVSSFLREEAVEQVDLLKIDVERAELDVLRGIDESDWPRIRQVAVEVHDEEGRVSAVSAMLAREGLRVAVDQEPAMRGTDVHMVYGVRP